MKSDEVALGLLALGGAGALAWAWMHREDTSGGQQAPPQTGGGEGGGLPGGFGGFTAIDPLTGLPVDPTTGLPTDPATPPPAATSGPPIYNVTFSPDAERQIIDDNRRAQEDALRSQDAAQDQLINDQRSAQNRDTAIWAGLGAITLAKPLYRGVTAFGRGAIGATRGLATSISGLGRVAPPLARIAPTLARVIPPSIAPVLARAAPVVQAAARAVPYVAAIAAAPAVYDLGKSVVQASQGNYSAAAETSNRAAGGAVAAGSLGLASLDFNKGVHFLGLPVVTKASGHRVRLFGQSWLEF